ncbi:hypothetical protein [Psychrobacillus sp. NEAU-3TGS]|nr:hypothetical protein [Psychrobacillus sp. NEAU-3TGS]
MRNRKGDINALELYSIEKKISEEEVIFDICEVYYNDNNLMDGYGARTF